MRRRVASSRDTLQVHLLPPVDYMELNYRPPLDVPAGSGGPVLLIATFALLVLFLPLWYLWRVPVPSSAWD